MTQANKTNLQSNSQSKPKEATTASTQADSKPKFNQERYRQVISALGLTSKLVIPKGLDEDYFYRWVATEDPTRVENLKSIGYEIVTKKDGGEYRNFAGVNDEKRSSGRFDFVLMRITHAEKAEIDKFKLIHRGQQQAKALDAAEIEEKYYTEEKQGSRKGDNLQEVFNNKYNPNNVKFF